MNALLAVDDGLANANYNWADIFFLVGTVLALFAAFAYAPTGHVHTTDAPAHRHYTSWAATLLSVAVACVAFALFLL